MNLFGSPKMIETGWQRGSDIFRWTPLLIRLSWPGRFAPSACYQAK